MGVAPGMPTSRTKEGSESIAEEVHEKHCGHEHCQEEE
jgi:hypothetical protein